MSETKKLLDALLCDIYGQQEQLARRMRRCCQDPVFRSRSPKDSKGQLARLASGMTGNRSTLERLDVLKLIDVCAILKVEILMLGYLLEQVLIGRDRLLRHQEVLCEFVTAVLVVESDDAQPKMRFSLSPPPQKAISSARITSPTSSTTNRSTTIASSTSFPGSKQKSSSMLTRNGGGPGSTPTAPTAGGTGQATDDDAASDYNQWLHAMKLVARLPGGTPPEFRRKLWLSLADKYLKSKNVDWAEQREKCFCEEWREDDEELGIQIVKDLHRTGSNLCTGPAGSINQAKLKRILLGYARYNPEVGYCQGFNMLGALILQVMDKEEEESMKVMIYLVEGVLPTGYFCGSMGGLQADMGVFRELMQTRLPRLAKHLQRLQGPVENAFEPPLTNVFTMQWFLTMFCTCLPMSCVLRVWDLVLIEGSDVLLRTALVLWSLLEERVLSVRSADEFYGKMGSYSSELLNGHLVDSNGLIERVVKLGPIEDLRKLRDKHLYNIAPLRHKQGLQLYYDEEDTHSDEERMAVATVWGLNWGRRGSVGPAAPAITTASKQQAEQKDRLALDISLLKKQYDRLRERQKQAHVILTAACSTAARQGSGPIPTSAQSAAVPVNQLLLGRPAIITNKGKRVSAPLGAIPPARKPSLPAVLHNTKPAEKQLRRGETLLWRDTDASRRRRDSLTWKEIKADRAAMMREGVDLTSVKTQKLRTRFGKSDSSSYSEDSDGEQEPARIGGGAAGGGSSTDTSLCDDDDPKSIEKSPKHKAKLARKVLKEQSRESSLERQRPKSWAPSSHEIPFMLMGADSGDEKEKDMGQDAADMAEDSATESGRFTFDKELDSVSDKLEPLKPYREDSEVPGMTSISPLPLTPIEKETAAEGILDGGVTNQYFERVNSVERPSRLELSYSLNEEETDTSSVFLEQRAKVEGQSGDSLEYKALPPHPMTDDGKVPQIRDDNIPGENKDDYKELLSMTIEEKTEEYKSPPPSVSSLTSAQRKRRDPRRRTLTRSSTIEIEERYQALERRISQEQTLGDSRTQSKYIPTTATLEERFHTLEKQLSAEKQRSKDSTDMEAEFQEKAERIPSTADLETRFNALTKQLSSSESSSKAPIDLKDDEPSRGSGSKEQSDNEKTSKLQKSEELEAESKESTAKSESSEGEEKKTEENTEERPRLKKLPSTAELEDRFNALERKMSVQKSSPAKTKKEPPDENVGSKDTSASKESDKTEKHVKKVSEEKDPKAAPNNASKEEKLPPKERNASDNESKIPSPDNPQKGSPSRKPSPDQSEKKECTKSNAADSEESSSTPERQKTVSTKKERHNEKDTKESQFLKKSDEESTKKSEASNEPIQTPRKSPPSTEELEKRFNALEKQLSSTHLETNKEPEQTKSDGDHKLSKEVNNSQKAVDEKPKSVKSFEDKINEVNSALVKGPTNNEVKDQTQEEVGPVDVSKSQATTEENPKQDLGKRRASEPPSTEDLEKRYESLKRRMSSKNQFGAPSETVIEALDRVEQEVISESGEESKKAPPSTEDLESRFEALQGGSKSKDVAIEAHIPEPPPPPPPPPALSEPVLHHQQALIAELQRKMGGKSPGEENLRPSQINPQKKQRKILQRPPPMGDETSEAPANTAYYLPCQQQRMVRRFSDLPSRADLENRLQFLERQLYKKFYKQRCASDSEVASKVRMLSDDDQPSTSRQAKDQLEQRVLALEKQLSENSLKLLEAMREREKAEAAPKSDDSGSPRRLSTETIDATGKELVRYTQNIGDLEEVDAHKPINISINIKMLLNKDGESKQPKSEPKPTTDDLRKRLEVLEQQLLEERAKNGTVIPDPERPPHDKPEKPEETDSLKKIEKNSHNQHVKSDETEKVIEPIKDKNPEPEAAKETKTLKNEEKAQVREKEVAIEKEPSKSEKEAFVNPESSQEKSKETSEKNSQKSEEAFKKDEPKAKTESPVKKLEETIKKDDSKATVEQPAQKSEVKKESLAPKTETAKEPSIESKVTAENIKSCPEDAKKKANEPPKDTQSSPSRSEKLKAEETSKENKPEGTKEGTPASTDKKDNSKAEVGNSSKEQETKCESIKARECQAISDSCDLGSIDANNKTVVLLMDNEPRASRVRRLTRANTEELEGLFQALEKQLQDRNLIKSEDGRLIRAENKPSAEQTEQAQAITDLTKEIEDFTSGKPEEKEKPQTSKDDKVEEPKETGEDYDWGPNPVKHHLKRKTVYLPSTKELEARFRSLERQIKLLEDVEKIDVEQRLNEIERKIKLQYSLSHEKDLNKYLELCEGKGLDDEEPSVPEEAPAETEETRNPRDRSRSPARKVVSKSPYTSPSRSKATKSPYTSPSRQRKKTPHSSPIRTPEPKTPAKSPFTSPARRQPHPNDLPISDDLEYKYRVLDLVRSKSKENLAKRMNDPNRKPAVHPLELLLSPSPDESKIPTTGELEHRIRVLDEKLKSPSRSRPKSRSRSPTIEDIKRQKMRDNQKPRTPVHNLERLVGSPGRPEPPTAEELEERIRLLEQEQKFDFKTQKDYKAFNQKLKDVISPSLSFEEFRAAKSREQSPRRHGATTPKSALRRDDYDDGITTHYHRPTSPKVIRFRDEDEDEDRFEESPPRKQRTSSDRMTLADQPSAIRSYANSSEGLDALGSRLMRETSPITRTGTHTGVPLRTGENINDRLSSIKNTIKSIDTLCEEKPYQKEKCQRYIDSLFSDSLHFSSKKSSLEDLRTQSRSESRGRSRDYAPSIRVTSEHRSLGSEEDSRKSPLRTRDQSPLHYRSHRELSREVSPRRRRQEEDEEEAQRRERESSRVRRDNLLPNYLKDNRSELSGGSSLTGFNHHKVDRQLEETCAKYAEDARRSACRTPLSHPYETRSTAVRATPRHYTDPDPAGTSGTGIGAGAGAGASTDSFPRPVSPYRQPYDPYRPIGGAGASTTPVYQPAKLEIRHTTVTSTFYDRFLTEKKIERSRPPSRSPVVSPSVPAKSYGSDVEFPSSSTTTSAPSCTTTTTAFSTTSFMSRSYGGTSFSLPSSSNYSYLSGVSGISGSATSPRASCSDLRSSPATSFLSTTTSSAVPTSSYVPFCFSSSFSTRLSDPITSTPVTTSSSLTHSTGVYNPMMSFTLREPLGSSTALGGSSASPLGQYQFKSVFTSNFGKDAEKP
ncbi:serine/arginine repetitive matrix protein 2 isoform X3 [Drosophila ananassae]|uniref:serine/arginine repetitive matrix protein 2 isoform X3 n=1 Tax=Drosophila ananassae TaxID=7217 RepID=UPI0013A5DA9A|nr:serine/arginine repetitive matrix protein 2 isoform X3 [Drosophila ananassae]